MDLLTYKQPWLAWCAQRSISPSNAFREVVAKLLRTVPKTPQQTGAVLPGEPEKTVKRMEIRLTPSELDLVQASAAAEGFSPTRWVVALIRARLTNGAQFGQAELEALARSNLMLRAIGRNLNQIARALNTSPHERLVYRVDQIEAVDAAVKEHTRLVAQAMTANTERWRIE